jgi:hypothetical protein
MLLDVGISGDRNVIRKEAEKILKYKYFTKNKKKIKKKIKSAHVEYKNKSDTSNNRSDWNHFKIIKKTPEQNIRKSRISRNYKKQPYWALHTYIRKNYVKVQNVYHGE